MSNSYCRRCCRQFGCPLSMLQHENNSKFYRSLIWICEHCEEGFQYQSELTDHKQSQHPNTCNDCNREFSSRNNLKEHGKKHLPRNMKCTHCNRKFTLIAGLFLHFEGGGCSGGFNRRRLNNTAQHVDRLGHFTLTPSDDDDSDTSSDGYHHNYYSGNWICEKCDRGFEKEIDVIKHLRSTVHSEKQFICNGCDMEFVNLSALAQHLESKACGWTKGLRMLKNFVHGLRTRRRFTIRLR